MKFSERFSKKIEIAHPLLEAGGGALQIYYLIFNDFIAKWWLVERGRGL